jgi:hypothetical protein
MSLPGIEFARQVYHAVGRLFERAHECICRVSSKVLELVYTHMNKSTADHDLEANIPPIVHAQNERPPPLRHITDGEKSIMTVDARKTLSTSVTGLQSDKLSDIQPPHPSPRVNNYAQRVKMYPATSSSFGIVVSPREPQRQSTSSSTLTAGDRNRKNGGGEPVRAVFRLRVAAPVPKSKVVGYQGKSLFCYIV